MDYGTASFVRMIGLEPTRRKTLDPKSSAAANYATCAVANAKLINPHDLCKSWGFCKKGAESTGQCEITKFSGSTTESVI